jgi:hypothetical protein
MPIILDKDILTKENTVKIITKKGVCVFNGTEQDLIKLIKDTIWMADAINSDLEAGNIDASNELIAIQEYQNFATKYS